MQIYLLGKTELLDDGGNRVSLPTRKVFLLLAILCMNQGKFLSRRILSETVWPSVLPESGRTSLRNALASLRKAIGESAIVSTDDQISLLEECIDCDAQSLTLCEEYVGDFMPGYSDDWVLDERLRLRELAAENAIERASILIDHGDTIGAMTLLETAGRIDPLNMRVAEMKVTVLESLGKTSEAAQTATRFQSRVLRDLGVLCHVDSKPKADTNLSPLVTTGEWLIDRNPDEAVSFLAATRMSWLALDGKVALGIHERALDASHAKSSARVLVDAQRLYLMWVVGKFEESAHSTKNAFDQAIDCQEFEAAAILGSALSYGLLSQGHFAQALGQANQTRLLTSVKNPLETIRAERNLAIIEQHAGKDLPWELRIRRVQPFSDEQASPEEIAQQNLIMTCVHLRAGKLDAAAESCTKAQRYFETCGGTRLVGFAIMGQVEILEAVGDYAEAAALLNQIRSLGVDTIGHSLAASIDDAAGRIYAQMSELDVAAESLARSILFRRRLGSRPSLYESSSLNPTRRLLKEKMDERDIRAAFSRAKLSFPQPA